MGLKVIFLLLLIGFSIYLWRRQRKKKGGKPPRWVDWVLGGMAVYYGIAILLSILGMEQSGGGLYYLGVIGVIGALLIAGPKLVAKLRKK